MLDASCAIVVKKVFVFVFVFFYNFDFVQDTPSWKCKIFLKFLAFLIT